jgi:hypothetical protein
VTSSYVLASLPLMNILLSWRHHRNNISCTWRTTTIPTSIMKMNMGVICVVPD